ncbi:hypothetical protein AB7M49_005879 [Bradyrhizobium elkanii]|nr:hypothetical protein [Bradyrhizobium elkanii]MCP1968183.1 hypothetical protein [Bradyrhizobium elkanii]MCS4110316.1 hypothetical protein [Bradyrhizobium elkanii]WLA85800.1 hypothetical protein QNJ99_17235 [Bradyrhizobium elkanii]
MDLRATIRAVPRFSSGGNVLPTKMRAFSKIKGFDETRRGKTPILNFFQR